VAEGVADQGADQADHVVHHRAGSRTTDAVDEVHPQRQQLSLKTVATSILHGLSVGEYNTDSCSL